MKNQPHLPATNAPAQPRKTSPQLQRRARFARGCAILATSIAVTTLARAALLTWDSDATFANGITDGSGTWDTTLANWNNGSADVPWQNANNDIAVFGNGLTGGTTAATVTLGTAITAGGLTFNTSSLASNYTIAGN